MAGACECGEEPSGSIKRGGGIFIYCNCVVVIYICCSTFTSIV